ncbi:DUF3488 and transglutaminase-like domain-containing protein [Paraconexibacter antarcticus]|uniref:DUF3488 and transglutaminase-like domain-containing protein n=1 Tax=Paraconexibacter antarcticus TaxID=2949664 RepID=A0ABY5DLN1_9ACTN|nr:transglutaminase domain-containing protein [Paraconexibacter antarcticus]UTI62750.1 DUF3488 and transglutaminase-like domain-containing protein [Paraconexibacter antarcticus]
MSPATAAPAPPPSRPAAPAAVVPPDEAPVRSGPLFLARPVRLVAFALLALLVARRWERLADPILGDAAARSVLLAVTAGALLHLRPLLPRTARPPAAAALAVAALVAALLVAGVPLHDLRPHRWDDLARGIGDGLAALPDLRVPYRGEQEWIRRTLALGGALLLLLAAVCCCAGRGRPGLAAGVLLTAYVIAVTQVEQRHAIGDGVLLTVLLALLLLGERVRMDQATAAGLCLAAAVGLGTVAVHRLDGARPWIDYRGLGSRLGSGPLERFSWTHTYGALPWTRDARPVLRVKAVVPGYWKAVSLDRFDGRRWRRAARPLPGTPPRDRARAPRAWTQEVSVDVADLRSPQLYAPGEILAITRSSVAARPDTPGTEVTAGRDMVRGDTYVARVYSPSPSVAQLARAGVDYPAEVLGALRLDDPGVAGSARVVPVADGLSFAFAPYGAAGSPAPRLQLADTRDVGDGTAELVHSPYARMWALAQRLKAASTSPLDYVRRVQARVRSGATYDEHPPRASAADPLADFLFGTRRGYCQQFSGAMALLLRMGGVPARVAEGFAPGTFDVGQGRYVVHDSDAHSWVEVYYPHIGWTVVDPTPALAPAASQFDLASATATAAPKAGATGATAAGDRAGGAAPGASAVAGGGGGGGPGALLLAGAGAALMLLAGGGIAVRHRRARRHAAVPPELRDLAHALHRAGVVLPPATTLAGLAAAHTRTPEARARVEALARARYAVTGAAAPVRLTRAERRVLRRGLRPAPGPPPSR